MPNLGSLTPKIQPPLELLDPIQRVQTLYLIKDKQSQVRKLKLNRIQQVLYDKIRDDIENNRPLDLSVLKFRQGGVSTFFLLLHLDRTIWTPNVNTGVLADIKENLGYLFEIVRFAHESMPEKFKPELGDDSKSSLSFPEQRSKIFVSLEIKSTTLHGLHISEAAYIEKERVQRTIGACTPGAWVTSETTANGRNHFHKRWNTDKQRGRKTLFLPWPLQEEYRIPAPSETDTLTPLIRTPDEDRLAKQMKRDWNLDMDDRQFRFRRQKRLEHERLFDQEMAEDEEACFISTGGAFFSGRKIRVLDKEAEESNKLNPPVETKTEMIWEQPQPRHVYVAGVDVMAEGHGEDPDWHVVAVICGTCRKTSARYRSRAGLDLFYRECDRIGRKYNNCLMAPEREGPGQAIILGLTELGYPNIYREEPKATRINHLNPLKEDLKKGWSTNKESKRLMMDQLRFALEGKYEDDEETFEPEFTVLDTEFLAETLNIMEVDGKIGAASGYHDDMVVAYAIAFQMYLRVRRKSLNLGQWFVGGKLESATDQR